MTTSVSKRKVTVQTRSSGGMVEEVVAEKYACAGDAFHEFSNRDESETIDITPASQVSTRHAATRAYPSIVLGFANFANFSNFVNFVDIVAPEESRASRVPRLRYPTGVHY
jgi:hypothetical protein